MVDNPMIYFNIGWMAAYAGHDNDPISGGHRYIAENQVGGEAFNFMVDNDGRVRGCRPGSIKNLRIERLSEVARTEPFVDGVTVIWIAREPTSGQTVIVGWYRNARVYRAAIVPSVPRQMPNGDEIPVTAETLAADAILLPVEARNFQVQSRRTSPIGFGQSPTWYGNPTVDDRVRSYISRVEQRLASGRSRRSGGRQIDPDKRKSIEEAAINHAIAYYQSDAGGGCDVVSVESEARGWDLEATSSDKIWLIEVKGLSGTRLSCEVTPNEYKAMMSKAHQSSYVIYVVCNALDGPVASLFRWSKKAWRTEDGRTLEIKEKLGAVLTCD